MAGIKVIVGDGDVCGGPGLAGFDGDIVISGANVRISNSDVGGGRWIDAVCVAGSCRSINPDAPGREAVGAVYDGVEVWRIPQRDSVQGEIVRGINHQYPWTVLPFVFSLCLLCQIPPGNSLSEKCCSSAPINHAQSHDPAM